MGLNGILSGTGELVKNGNGFLYFSGTNALPLTTVNAGVLNAGGRITGLVVVNAGGTLGGGGCCIGDSGVQDVDVLGGTFAPSFGLLINGKLRMLNGATFVHNIYDQGANGIHETYAFSVHQPMELLDCNLVVEVSPDAQIPLGMELTVIAAFASDAATGTFNDLTQGSRFVVNGHDFTISYQGGINGNYVTLVAGAPFVWDGGGSGNVWGTAANWVADVAPLPDHDLIFPSGVSKLGMINAFDPGTRFRSLTFGGPSYLLLGNSFRLTGGIYNDVASGDTTISADLMVSGNFTSRVSNASRLLLEGGVTGNAPWRKTGTGTLRLTGTLPNTQAEMEVREGELELDKASGVNAISALLEIGDGTNDVRVTLLSDHQIADTAGVTIRNRARLNLNGQEEAIDRLQGDGLVSLDGRFIPGRSARLTVSSGTFNGTIVGDGGLTKTGSSSSLLTLSGDNTFSGMTILDGGTLAVEGVQVNSPIRLNGGVLRGRGSVGSITGNLGGVVQPGFNGAAFQNRFHSSAVALNATTTFRPVLTSADPGFENTQLQVSGTVSLGGSVLSVDLLGNFKPANNISFVIIDNDGADPIVGTFAGLPEGAVFGGDGLPFRISYVGGTGNDVVITRAAAPASTLSSITLLSNGQMRVEGLGIGGVIYPIQAASNLNPVIFWTNVGNGTGDAGGLFRFIDTGASNRPMRFYRAVSP